MKRYAIPMIGLMLAVLLPASCAKEEFGGLGIEVPSTHEIVTDENPYRIVSVYEGGTGNRAGLKAGDVIESVDGVRLKGLANDYIVKSLLRGRVGSVALLSIKRGGETVHYTVQRGRIVLRNE